MYSTGFTRTDFSDRMCFDLDLEGMRSALFTHGFWSIRYLDA